jgi:hypothetical protein
MALVQQAIEQTQSGVEFADEHGGIVAPAAAAPVAMATSWRRFIFSVPIFVFSGC